jgi:hypothetical protein
MASMLRQAWPEPRHVALLMNAKVPAQRFVTKLSPGKLAIAGATWNPNMLLSPANRGGDSLGAGIPASAGMTEWDSRVLSDFSSDIVRNLRSFVGVLTPAGLRC